MDFSKLTPEQLLEMLQNQSPELYSRVNNYMNEYNVPVSRALKDYQIPSMIRDNYDLNLFNEQIPFNDQASLGTVTPFLYNTDVINREFNNAPGYGFLYENQFNFPSDYYNQDDLNNVMQGTSEYSNAPAVTSAAAILANNRQIGDSDYTIDDLKANGMSDEQLLEFLRGLTNKGYKI